MLHDKTFFSEITKMENIVIDRVDQAIAIHSATVLTVRDAQEMVTSVQTVIENQGLAANVELSFGAMAQFVTEQA